MVALWGPGQQTSQHAHHAVHLLVALSGSLRVSGVADDVAGVFVPADVPHAIDGRGAVVLTVFIEPESATGVDVSRRWGSALQALDQDAVAALVPASVRTAPTPASVGAWLEEQVRRGPIQMHPRIRRLLAMLRERPLGELDTSARALASSAGLSESRFLHVFKESTGTSLRRYLLWLRLQRAASLILTEQSLTAAAFSAGFSDAAHMTRTFRRLLGITPSALVQHNPQTQATMLGER